MDLALALLRTFLSSPIWQGVAGIAQIFAAGLSTISVFVALWALHQAKKERVEAVAPDWAYATDLNLTDSDLTRCEDCGLIGRSLQFKNVGIRCATKLRASIEATDDPSMPWIGETKATPWTANTALAGSWFQVPLYWSPDEDYHFVLVLQSSSWMGQRLSKRFSVEIKSDNVSV